jgi:chitinase
LPSFCGYSFITNYHHLFKVKTMRTKVLSVLALGSIGAMLSGCGGGNSSTSPSGLTITRTPTPVATHTFAFVFSPYKEISSGGQTTSLLMEATVNGSTQTQTSAMPAGDSTVTWAFAAGNCGSETWDQENAAAFAAANVPAFVSAGKNYIISTGGYAQQFFCTSDAGFAQFIQTYYSSNMLGVDFDIESGSTPDWTQSNVNDLIQRVIVAQKTYPNLRFSFTVPTDGGIGVGVGSYGQMVMQAIMTYGLQNYLINLETMDYGSVPSQGVFVLANSGLCDMGASAVQAAVTLNAEYEVPYNQIELTPMIGENDSTNEIFQIADVATVATFAMSKGLAGVHFWSFDRDSDCPFNPAGAPYNCNGVNDAGSLGYTNAFVSALGL